MAIIFALMLQHTLSWIYQTRTKRSVHFVFFYSMSLSTWNKVVRSDDIACWQQEKSVWSVNTRWPALDRPHRFLSHACPSFSYGFVANADNVRSANGDRLHSVSNERTPTIAANVDSTFGPTSGGACYSRWSCGGRVVEMWAEREVQASNWQTVDRSHVSSAVASIVDGIWL